MRCLWCCNGCFWQRLARLCLAQARLRSPRARIFAIAMLLWLLLLLLLRLLPQPPPPPPLLLLLLLLLLPVLGTFV